MAERIYLRKLEGGRWRTGSVASEASAEQMRAEGWEPVSKEVVDDIKRVREASPVAGTISAAASGATLGLSDVVQTELFGRDPKDVAAEREAAGALGDVAQVAGAVAPALLTGGAGTAASAARLAPAGRLAAAGGRVARGTEAALGGGRAAKLVGAGAGAAYEGATFGAGMLLSERALGGPEITGERLLQSVGGSAGLGMMLGIAGRGAVMGAPAAGALASKGIAAARGLKADVAGFAVGAIAGPRAGFATRAAMRASGGVDDAAALAEAQKAVGMRGLQAEEARLQSRIHTAKAEDIRAILEGAEGGRVASYADDLASLHEVRAEKYLARAEQHVDEMRAREADITRLTDRMVFKSKAAAAAQGVAEGVGAAGRRAMPIVVARATSPETRRDDLLKIRDRVNELAADPLKLAETLDDGELLGVAPEAGRARTLAASRAIAYLKSVEPPTYRPPFSGGVELVSQAMLDEYEQQVQATVDPIGTIYHGLKRGTLTPTHVRAIQAVYPKQLEKLRADVLEKLGAAEKAGKAIDSAARVRLGVMLGMPLDASLLPQNYGAIQQSIAYRVTGNQPPAPSKNPGRPAPMGDN